MDAPPREQILVPNPIAAAGGRVIASPFQWLFQGEDSLRLVVANSAAGVRLRMQGRFLSTSKGVQVFTVDVTPTTDRMTSTKLYQPGDGYLLNLSIVAVAGAPVIGQTYAMVQIVRGFSGAIVVLGALLGGYVTTAQHLAYPGSPIQSSIEGGGYYRTVEGTMPAAGNNISEIVPAGARWEFLSFYVGYGASVAIGDRRTSLVVWNGSGFVAVHQPLVTLTAGLSAILQWQRGPVSGTAPAPGAVYVGSLVEDLVMSAGMEIFTLTDIMDAADIFTTPVYGVREWLEVA